MNQKIITAIKKVEGKEFDCSNPDKYVVQMRDDFSISKKGISFYMKTASTTENTAESEEGASEDTKLFFSFEELKPLIKNKSLLAEIMK